MVALKYWDAAAGRYVVVPMTGPQGPTGPTGPAGPAGRAAAPEVASGVEEPQLGEDLWVLPDAGGAALMMRSGGGWVPRNAMGGARATGVGTPTVANDIATKGYVDTTAPIGSTAWVNIPYQNGWSTYPGRNPPLRSMKTRDGVVYVEGNLRAGSSDLMGYLPVGHRPAYGLHVHAWRDIAANGYTRITVGQDGSIAAANPNTGGQFFVLFSMVV